MRSFMPLADIATDRPLAGSMAALLTKTTKTT
jgi:hypothetical protein